MAALHAWLLGLHPSTLLSMRGKIHPLGPTWRWCVAAAVRVGAAAGDGGGVRAELPIQAAGGGARPRARQLQGAAGRLRTQDRHPGVGSCGLAALHWAETVILREQCMRRPCTASIGPAEVLAASAMGGDWRSASSRCHAVTGRRRWCRCGWGTFGCRPGRRGSATRRSTRRSAGTWSAGLSAPRRCAEALPRWLPPAVEAWDPSRACRCRGWAGPVRVSS